MLVGTRNGRSITTKTCKYLQREAYAAGLKSYHSLRTRWEKYDAKGWTEKGAHKYGRLNEQSWWEKWGEHYDGRGSVLKWFALLKLFAY